MKKWYGSTAAKIVAWILLTISAVACVASIAVIAVMTEENVYKNSLEETKEAAFSNVSDRYSLLAMYNYYHGGSDANKEVFGNIGFEYGIIEAETLDELDLNSEKTYLERNFSEKVTAEDLHVYTMEITEDTSIDYKDGFLTGYAYMNNDARAWTSLYADKICYDDASGILYYKTEGDEYFPVQSVRFEWQGNIYFFYYNFEKEQYEQKLETVTETTVTTEADVKETAKEENAELSESEEAIASILEQRYFNFNMLEEQGDTRENWGNLLLDGVREIDAAELTPIDIERDGLYVTEERNYYLNENYSLMVNYGGNLAKHYIVVSIPPQEVEPGWSEDMFVQANTLVNLMYDWRYSVFAVCLISLLLGIGSFLFLLLAAGRRKDTEEIVPLFTDKIWLDVAFVLICVGELVLLMVMDAASYYLPNTPYLQLFVFAGLCMGWLLLWFILSFAVRVKLGKWWRNTLIYKVCTLIGRFLGMVGQNAGFLWGWILLMLFLAFCEFVGLVVFQYNTGMTLLLWFLEKVVLYVLIICGLVQMNQLKEGGEKIAAGDLQYKIDTNRMSLNLKRHGENLNSISEGMSRAVDERMKSERFKTELITNVSHDIKTPLTSIINYVDLLEKEEFNNATAEEYLEVLERQSGRLKKLIEDLIEASKASTGNLPVHLERLEAGVFMVQTVGEFEEKTKAVELDLQIKKPEQPIYIMADGRHFWRVIDNLMNNICKYAQPGTRVYIDMEEKGNKVEITFRNTSKYPLNISSEELMERFVRGDSSRNTEGSGLGLSIANSLMELIGGTFKLYVDGDLFKVVLEFEEAVSQE